LDEVKVRILGISATPIKDGNCDKAVQEALKAAAELGDVETEFITLADKNIAMCKHCQWCIENMQPCKVQDDFQMVFEKMKESDGLILGGPTWFATLSPHLLILFSRMRYYVFFTHALRNKVVGAVTVGFLGFGMQRALETVETLAWAGNMVSVGGASTLSSTRVFGQRPAYLEHGVLDDKYGMREVKMMGGRVVEIARMIKYATEAGLVLPEKYKRTVTGAILRPREDKMFVEGVWREKEA